MKLMRGRKTVYLLAAVLLLTILCAGTALADNAGWNKKGETIWYNLETEEGLARAVGLQQIGAHYYMFEKDGSLLTGWQKTADGYRYFQTDGEPGTIGRMYVGLKKIGKYRYCFDENGVVRTGFTELAKGTYYFTKKGSAGVIGRSLVKKWAKYKGGYYYFGANGKMVRSKWVGSFYVGADGKRLVNTITPDGYRVGAKGKKLSTKKVSGLVKVSGRYKFFNLKKSKFVTKVFKTVKGKKYYFGKDGYAVTGWQKIKGATYYFGPKGVMKTGVQKIGGKRYLFADTGKLQKSAEVDGYKTDENGVIVAQEQAKGGRILVLAGHGQGDSGAVSGLGQEYLKTREFAKLIVNELKSSEKVTVTYYKNGSTSFDMYQQNARTLGSSGLNIGSQITGRGTIKNKVLSGMKTNPNLPVLTDYDYVLEIHFNATAVSSKDPYGNGSYKGFSFYVNNYKKSYVVERKMISKVKALGFSIFGAGVHASSTLFNPRICQEVGVDYSLMETAFIDDADDMRFYEKNKKKMAAAVAASIIEYYGK